MNNSYMHLTNVAIQKTSDNYDKDTGQKWYGGLWSMA